ncbi:hypothetical protein [Phormidesmis sp. 146-33]
MPLLVAILPPHNKKLALLAVLKRQIRLAYLKDTRKPHKPSYGGLFSTDSARCQKAGLPFQCQLI